MKTNAKPAVRILPLFAALIIILSGCAADFSRTFPFLSKQSVFEIEGDISHKSVITDSVFIGNALYLLQLEENEPDEEISSCLIKVNAKNAKVIKKQSLRGYPIENPDGIDVDGNGNPVLYGYEENGIKRICITCSADTLETSGKVHKYTASLPEISDEKNDFGLYFCEGSSCATYECYDLPVNPLTVLSFRTSEDKAIFTYSLNFNIFSDFGKLVIGKKADKTENTNANETVAVYDFENHTLVNTLETEKNGDENNSAFISSMRLNDRYAFFAKETQNEDDYSVDCYIWQYRKGSLNETFEYAEKSIDEIESDSLSLCKRIKKDYGINVEINSKNFLFYERGEEYYLSPDASVFDAYITLLRLKAFLDILPDGFTREIYSDLEFCSYDGFDIFIGGEIEGTSGAYTMTFLENMTIAFGAQSTDFRTVAHEFMHAMDVRIEDGMTDMSLFEIWSEQNDGFEYTGYSEDNFYYEDEAYTDYFVSPYSTATDGEDRAEIFSYLVTDSFSDDEEPYWYAEKAHLRAKTDLLIKLIRSSFPSLEKANEVQWEKAVKNK